MEKEINYRKIIFSIFFISIAIVMLIGVSYAYFAGSVSGRMNTIASTESVDIQYSENRNYMYGSLVPASEEDAIKGATNEVDNGICKDSSGNDYYVCSLYEFTVDNMSNVNQDIEVYLYQQINGYENLKYMVYETSISDSNFDVSHKIIKSTSLVYPNEVQDSLGTRIEGLTKRLTKLDNSVTTDSVTYTIVFYVENMDYNQSEEDGGKQIVADIHVVSKTSNNLFNVPSKVGELTTQTKYYLVDSITDFVTFYNGYAIVNISGLDADHLFFGLKYDNDSYTVLTNMGGGALTPLPLTVTNNGATVSFTTPSGVLTFNKSSDTMLVEYDETYELYVNIPYYDNNYLNHLEEDDEYFASGDYYYYAVGFVRDNLNYYGQGSRSLSASSEEYSSFDNLIFSSSHFAAERMNSFTSSNNGTTIVSSDPHFYLYTYSIREN